MNYFTDQPGEMSQPIMPPAPNLTAPAVPSTPTAPNQQPIQPTVPEQYKGLPVRAVGDRVFILKGGKRYWVTSPEVYNRLGFKFGDEVKVDQATLDVIPEGEPIR